MISGGMISGDLAAVCRHFKTYIKELDLALGLGSARLHWTSSSSAGTHESGFCIAKGKHIGSVFGLEEPLQIGLPSLEAVNVNMPEGSLESRDLKGD